MSPLVPLAAPAIIGVPAYGYPHAGSMWDGLAELDGGSIVIVNPDNGPGDSVDPTYERAMIPLREHRVTMYGYVDTAYGKRTVGEVIADAERFVEMYRTTGIFLDQIPGEADAVAYLGEISAALRRDHLQVAFNPGQPVIDRRLVPLADHIMNFEGDVDLYRRTEFPAWADEAPAGLWWHLVYDVAGSDDLGAVLDRAAGLGAGVVFVTDGLMPNPWDHLPHYWHEELARVRR